jgi:hypothetical protein
MLCWSLKSCSITCSPIHCNQIKIVYNFRRATFIHVMPIASDIVFVQSMAKHLHHFRLFLSQNNDRMKTDFACNPRMRNYISLGLRIIVGV